MEVGAMDAKTIRVLLCMDVGSLYSWICLVLLLRYKERWSLKLHVMPVLLGAVHKLTGNAMPSLVPARGRWLGVDMERNAKFMGIPYKGIPSSFGSASFNSMYCQRLLTAVALAKGYDSDDLFKLCVSLFESIWGVDAKHEVDIMSKNFLFLGCSKAGLTKEVTEGYIQMSSQETVKQLLKENTALAVKHGAFGTPTMFVRTKSAGMSNSLEQIGDQDLMFFGSDRFEQLAFMLGKPWNGPFPSNSKL
ncbi:hypothetical protein O6H91_20G042100 [Diphasiastrum complanatum]|uniref:Uncharacterized protein n=1 Tax=Diphasiastrum complanatum TaxID=34168 RepID=A0ACC2APM2_DIPCM|nr:hypothetical protein O6H91_20G042100 [Diphasiastrum complanatum]